MMISTGSEKPYKLENQTFYEEEKTLTVLPKTGLLQARKISTIPDPSALHRIYDEAAHRFASKRIISLCLRRGLPE